MVIMHPRILKRDGKEAFAVFPYEEFLRIREELEEYADFKALRAAKAKEHAAPTTSLRTVRRRLGI